MVLCIGLESHAYGAAKVGFVVFYVATFLFLASYVQCGSANGATRPDPLDVKTWEA